MSVLACMCEHLGKRSSSPTDSSAQVQVLLVGGAGFVGQALAAELLLLHCSVSVLDVLPSRIVGAAFHYGDVTDKSRLSHVVRAVNPLVIIHLASSGIFI